MRVERTLLVINRAAGTGHGPEVVERLGATLAGYTNGRATLQVEVVEDHLAARTCAAGFLAASGAPALVVVGGGSGTLRAVIEGICEGSAPGELPGRERVRVGALRMGSGNPLARQFGAPRDPKAGLEGIIRNLRADRTAPCCVMRCEVGTPEGRPEARYAATMGGFGQFGRVPGDLERWHRRSRGPRKVAAGLLGIERLNHAEYAVALLARSARCALLGSSAVEEVEVDAHGRKEILRLLAGVAMNFPLQELPVDPGVRVGDEAVSLYLVPLRGRLSALRLVLTPRRLLRSARWSTLKKAERVEVRLLDRDSAEFFLDEDPVTFHRNLTLQIAGTLAFVPSLEYPHQTETGVPA